jgi:hypothetical protein
MAEFTATHQPAQTRTSDPQRPSPSRVSGGPVSISSDIGRLSRAIGNRGVHQLLRSHGVQPKMTVGPVDDEYEQEAHRVADDVMRMPDPGLSPIQRTPVRVQRKCSQCEAEEEKVQRTPADVQRACAECEKEKVQRLGESGEGPAMSVDEGAMSGLEGGGRPLQEPTRQFFEDRMGHDFSSVRVHTDGAADTMAQSIQATAFAHGPHLVFRSGAYAPGTESGRRLLAHELTHTIQQGASAPQSVEGDAADTAVSSD